MASNSGVIKEVISGDTVKIIGKGVDLNGPPPEITITLASILAPRLKGTGGGDEPFAWESREFLRELCIGKRVNFKILQVVNAINRTFGEVMMITDGPELFNLQLAVVENGWATVKTFGTAPGATITPTDPIYYLYEAEQRAIASKLGIHSGQVVSNRPPMVVAPTQANIDVIFRKYKGSPTPVIIEYIRDGASLRVLLLDCWTYVSLSMTGVYCPRFNSSGSKEQAGPDPYAEQSRLFTQMRILNRKLFVNIEAQETNGSGLIASILHPKGNIAVDLIRAGLGKVFDRSLGYLPKETVIQMRQAENAAKLEKRGIWDSFVATAPSLQQRSYEAICIEVLSGDTIVVIEGPSIEEGVEKRLTLAGIRVPRTGAPGGSGPKAGNEPWSVECRELLISLLVGKKVTVTEEYARPATDAAPSRVFASVAVLLPVGRGKLVPTNVAEHLLVNGVCTCVRYKSGSEEERVKDFDLLLIAENAAQTAGKGLHGSALPPSATAHAVNDMTTDGKKAKQYFALLQTGRGAAYKGPATVEYVFTGSRCKVYLPYPENCYLQLSLSEVRCPLMGKAATSHKHSSSSSSSSGAPPSAARSAEPFAEEARQFTRRRLTQRTVEVEVTDMDKNGIALGRIFYSAADGSRESLAQALVGAGLAKVDKYLVTRGITAGLEPLLQAQESSRSELRGVWSVPEEEEPEAPQGSQQSSLLGAKPGQLAKVRVSEIDTGAHFYVHLCDTEGGEYPTKTLQEIEQAMVSFDAGIRPEVEESQVKRGQLCICRYPAEPGKWFRGKVVDLVAGATGEDSSKIMYIDYGNTDTVPLKDVVPFASSAFLFNLPAQAIECCLALVFAHPVENDSTGYGREAALYFNDLVWDKDLILQVISSADVSSTGLAVALYEMGPAGTLTLDHVHAKDRGEEGSEQTHSVNEEMILQGLARISKTAARKMYGGAEKVALLTKLRNAQFTALRNHVNMFRYGDPGDSDDEDKKSAITK